MEVHVEDVLRLASSLQRDVTGSGFSPTPVEHFDTIRLYDNLITHSGLRRATRKLLEDRHYSRAVEECFKYLNNVIKAKSRIIDADGASLMQSAFSAKNPRLALNDLRSKSKQDEQIGYSQIFAGCMTGVRNPRAHEHGDWDDPHVALELLSLGNHLMRKVDASIRKRNRRATK